MRRLAVGLLVLISAICLLVSSTSLWVRHNFVNTDVFVTNVERIVDLKEVEARVTDQVTTTVMANPQVKDAIDSAVDALPPRLQQFRPTVENGIRSLVSAGVAKLLADDPFRPLTEAAVTSAHQQLVNGQAVRFTLGQAKDLVPAGAQQGLAGQVLALLPDDVGITLLTPSSAPRVYDAVSLLKSAWGWLALVALGTLAGALALSHRRRKSLRAWSVTTAVLCLAVLLTLRVARGRVVAAAKPVNRDALGAIYDDLGGSLRSWTLWLTAIVLVVLVGTLLWGRIGLVAGVRRGVRSAREQVASRREQQAAASSPVAGAEGRPVPVVVAQPWYRRVGEQVAAFAAGLGLQQRAAQLGTFVRAHSRPARWTGIVLGVFVLLLWPSPELSVLIWVGALVALYIGGLEWLQSQAPEPAAEPVEGTPVEGTPVEGTTAPGVPARLNGSPVAAEPGPVAVQPIVPAARTAPETARTPVLTAPSGGAGRTVAEQVTAVADPDVPPAPGVPAPTTAELLTTLSGRLDVLSRLGAARDAGMLTDEEFLHEKDRVMAL